MLAMAEVPLPSPVQTNPCDPAMFGSSFYDLGGDPHQTFAGSVGSSTAGALGTSSTGVRYFDGMVGATSVHIQSDALDGAFGIATTWTGYSLLSNNLGGLGISNPYIPKLTFLGIDTSKMLVTSGAAMSWFYINVGADTYTPMFFGHETLTHNTSTHEFVFVDSSGRTLTFYDDNGGVLAYKIKSTVSPGGIGTYFVYHNAGALAGAIDYVHRSGTFHSQYAEERFAYSYNSWGLVSQTKQAHDGAVDGSTPAVTYTHADGATGGEAKYVRLTGVVYPGGEDVYYVYPSSGIGNALNRVDAISDNSAGTTKFAQYTYLGVSTIVAISHPAISGGLKLSYGSAGTYGFWDRFGRIIEQKWTNDSGSTVRDRTQYTYDRNSNITARTNPQKTTLSETYTFDGLDRLASVVRNGSAYQSWSLEGSGNWKSFTNQGSTQTRTHNAANEVSTISGKTSPSHDANGNVTQAPKPATTGDQVYVYDGWNRLTQVKETGGSVIATYEYDPRGNRIQKTISSTVRDFYHNEASQVVEVRVNGTLNQVFVWDLSFIDSPVMTKRDTGSDGTLDQSYYFTFDALRNVTALINASNGNVLERYHYDAFGKVQMYNGSWTTISSSAYANNVLFTGRERDTESGLYYFRARYFDPALGRFLARDPIGYVDGMNLYQGYFVHGGVDPSGMDVRYAGNQGGVELLDVYTTEYVFGMFGGRKLGTVVYDPAEVSRDKAMAIATELFNKGESFGTFAVTPEMAPGGSFWDTGVGRALAALGASSGGGYGNRDADVRRGLASRAQLTEEQGGAPPTTAEPDVELYNRLKRIPFIGAGAQIAFGESIAKGETLAGVRNLATDAAEVYAGAKAASLMGSARRARLPEFPAGRIHEDDLMDRAIEFLGPGYREKSPGRFVSDDGLRQFRYGAHETRNPLNHHAHFEALDEYGHLTEKSVVEVCK